jgi:hypothetical protein
VSSLRPHNAGINEATAYSLPSRSPIDPHMVEMGCARIRRFDLSPCQTDDFPSHRREHRIVRFRRCFFQTLDPHIIGIPSRRVKGATKCVR